MPKINGFGYDPDRHHRRSVRLKGHDYSTAGKYFVTICCAERNHRFGEVKDSQMFLNDFGQIAHDTWFRLTSFFPNISLHAFVVMPNHVHGIIEITGPLVRATLAVAPSEPELRDTLAVAPSATPVFPTLGNMVGAYKSLVFTQCLKIYLSKTTDAIMGELWQRSFFENIIFDESECDSVAQYIKQNPANWQQDKIYNQLTLVGR